eukprot:10757027-Prorocentrum_lima.AAC.1
MSPANWDILSKVAAVLKGYRQPFLLGGDWNMESQQLRDTGWVESLDAEIVAPGRPTCFASSTGSELDYFVMSRTLRRLVASVE